jgi:diguanylate cyclase (GGDEF)-like protein
MRDATEPFAHESAKRILLLEADPGDAALVRSLLDESPSVVFEIEHVRRVQEALPRLNHERFDLILMDLWLPDANGLDALARIRPASGTTPIVALSSRDDEQIAVEAVKAGAQDYLVKGQVDARALCRTLLYALERQRMMLDLEFARQREHYLATHDSLTGLPNRPQFYERLSENLAFAERYDQLLAVLFLDLDQFKAVNDEHGHALGDLLLRAAASRMRSCVRGSDTVARLGGDEFTVLLNNIARPGDAGHVAENIIACLAAQFVFDRRELSVASSVGISIFPNDGTDPEVLIRNADAAMYSAKEQGPNSCRFFTPDLNANATQRRTMAAQLRESLAAQHFRVHYQTQVDTEHARTIGAEALVRWEHPQLGQVAPGEFIPVAEEAGLIGQIGEWVLRTACEQHATWRRDGYDDLRMAVNVSISQLRQKGFVGSCKRILEETAMDSSRLELEISERGIMRNATRIIPTIRALKELGVRISIDDFGTGHASLTELKQLPSDTLKIDRAFIRDLTSDASDAAMTSAIIAMAQNLDLETIAEGVETEEQAEFLQSRKCYRMQGFLFSRPVPAEAFPQP